MKKKKKTNFFDDMEYKKIKPYLFFRKSVISVQAYKTLFFQASSMCFEHMYIMQVRFHKSQINLRASGEMNYQQHRVICDILYRDINNRKENSSS